jgi:hypothetical protein
MSLRRVVYLPAVSVLFGLNLGAQSEGWNKVKSIAAGTEVRILVSGGAPVQGSLQSVTEDSVLLNSSSGQQTLSRKEVMRLSVKKEGRRKRHALIGLASGAGGGWVIGLAIPCTGFCVESQGEVAAVTTVLGALVGAVVGVAIPAGDWREVYKQ